MIEAIPWDGQKITKAGIYSGVPMEAYHSDICDGPSISSSGLRLLDSRSPAHYWAQSYLNPNRKPEEQKDAFDFGRAAHTLLLGESDFKKRYAVRPDEWSDWRTKDAKAWRDEMREAGRTVLVPDDLVAIRGMAASLARDPSIQAGLLQGHVERSIFWQDRKSGVWLKCRPDVIPVSDGIAGDIKTTTDASPDKIQRAVQSWGYDAQGALVGEAFRQVLGFEMTDFVLVWIEGDNPWAVNVSPVDPEWISYGARRNRRAIDKFAKCIEAGEWPAYPSEITTSMPDWLRKRVETETKFGLLPEIENTYREAAE